MNFVHESILRAPAEQVYAAQLALLAERDTGPRPSGWKLSPRAVRAFILGDEKFGIKRKFYGDDALVDRCIVTLMSDRGLLLVGEPGTAKSMLSELLSAAVSGNSACVIQGTAGTTEDQIKYSWNYALLLAEGPTPRALVRGPVYQAMQSGGVCRFEEVTRVQPEIQDSLIGVLSDKVLHVPELDGEAALIFAARGFNVLATANIRDRGVHEMSSALKRRFNFETVRPINDRKLEIQLVRERTEALLKHAQVDVELTPDVVELLVTAFHDLRAGVTSEGVVVEKPSAVMSSAEAVSVGFAACLDAHYFGDGLVGGEHIARQLIGTVLKDNVDDGKKLRHYFDVVVKPRAERQPQWRRVLEARRELDR
ncbi:AAA family ATPase [Herbaspirillum huttiense F1]|jgi:MoxR-like ATPases|uniref:AAA family ATPase n=1 Tax=Herbaspirillum huttiense subsp. lycopersici TaxID=3074428 RepID=A0ABU2EEM9_9BURK|nr:MULTISPECIES: AAA family ATPase [Herbaspirillum]MBP1313252.1 MoxR-like ATPase [Herbaspirillum sp. 1130]MDR6738488.1 MoxR-like ATPase [Herbaspirillum sp. 1173]MDR9846594.1 AAA family ATPase [Herbaspirillum huttiense SE1]MDT0356031.1 AAA family ATPase [Herbaspirillum huttiense F1]